MKVTTRTIVFTSLVAMMTAVGTAFAHYEYQYRHHCDDHMMGDSMYDHMPMSRLQGMMHQNQALMEQMVEEQDQQKREELMRQHRQSMHGQMMGRFMQPGSAAGSAPTQQHLEMMGQRLERMQKMIEQMQQQLEQN